MDSILTSIKKLLGVAEDYTHFDTDIIFHINSVFATLSQIGIKPEGFSIEDKYTTWDEYLNDSTCLHLVKVYVQLKVRLLFDPPSSSIVQASIDSHIKEYEWRLSILANGGENQNE